METLADVVDVITIALETTPDCWDKMTIAALVIGGIYAFNRWVSKYDTTEGQNGSSNVER